MKWLLRTSLTVFLSSCVLQSEPTTGPEGDPGRDGIDGDAGISPFRMNADGSIYYLDGSVGIGTASPSEALDVQGRVAIRGAEGDAAQLHLRGSGGLSGSEAGNSTAVLMYDTNASSFDGAVAQVRSGLVGDLGTGALELLTWSGDSWTSALLAASGKVRIGNGSPPGDSVAVLDVAGDVGQNFLLSNPSGTGYRAFFAQVSNGTVKIGATSGATTDLSTPEPRGPLALVTDDTDRIYIETGGNVGIGTTTPGQKLHVRGSQWLGSTDDTIDNPQLYIGRGTDAGEYGVVEYDYSQGAPNQVIRIHHPQDPTQMVIASTGDVGIGTATPKATLDINGTARLKPYSGAEPVACNAVHAGTIALTGVYLMCVCNGGIWRFVRDDQPCVW